MDPTSLVAAEGPFFVVVGDAVLPEFGPDSLQQITQSPDQFTAST